MNVIIGVAELAAKYDEDGVDVYFLNSKRAGKELKVGQLFGSGSRETSNGVREEQISLNNDSGWRDEAAAGSVGLSTAN